MTITQLEYVIAVDTYKNFAEAAKNCYVTQPTLSMQIKKLEEEMDILIFDRSKKPVLTTDIGQKLIDQAKLGLRELKKIPELVEEEEESIKGELRVGIIPTLSPYLVPRFITQFVNKYPDIHIVFEELLSDQITHKLSHDLIDVGILVSPLEDKNLVETPLFYESFVLYISTTHPLTNSGAVNFEDLNIDDMWLLKEGHCFRSQTINICTEKVLKKQHDSPLRFESGSLETLKKIVEQDFGYTLLPELAVDGLNEEQMRYVKYFRDPEPVREVSIVTHRSYLKKKLILLLKEEILNCVPEKLKEKGQRQLITWR